MIEVAIDIRMIEFHARQYDMLGTVVKELRPLVKKGTVIFVPLYHHVISFSRVPSAAKIDRHSATKKPGFNSSRSRTQAGRPVRGGLPVVTGNHRHFRGPDQDFS